MHATEMYPKATNTIYSGMASGATLTFPLATAAGVPSGFIPVIDSLSTTWSSNCSAAATGGTMRTKLNVNGSAVWSIAVPITVIGTATGTLGAAYGGTAVMFPGGLPLWTVSATLADQSVPVTAVTLNHTFSGSVSAAAFTNPVVDVAVQYHWENPAQRRN